MTFSPNLIFLTELNLSYCQHIGDENKLLFIQLGKKLTFLKSVDLSWSRITDRNLKHLLKYCLGDGTEKENLEKELLPGEDGEAGDLSDDTDGLKSKSSKIKRSKKIKTSSGSKEGSKDQEKKEQPDKEAKESSDGKSTWDKRRKSKERESSSSNIHSSLTYLNLTRCLRLTEKVIRYISPRAVNLQTLILSGASDCVTDKSLEWIGSHLSNLTKLDISNCHEVSSVAPLIPPLNESFANPIFLDGSGSEAESYGGTHTKFATNRKKRHSLASTKKELLSLRERDKDRDKDKDKDKKERKKKRHMFKRITDDMKKKDKKKETDGDGTREQQCDKERETGERESFDRERETDKETSEKEKNKPDKKSKEKKKER